VGIWGVVIIVIVIVRLATSSQVSLVALNVRVTHRYTCMPVMKGSLGLGYIKSSQQAKSSTSTVRTVGVGVGQKQKLNGVL
jgi:hypothetical protein